MAYSPTQTSRAVRGETGVNDELVGLPDDQLLDRFFAADERVANAAFQVLVKRHGPMVMGVCSHILNEVHDAEDAFQATFLVLARKANTINDRRVLARWLYEVAYRIAIRSKAHIARRRAHERQGAEMAANAPRLEQDHGWIELRPVLHEEVNKLPENYRAAVVLCYLEGRTNEEAAEMLQWPVGTVKGRLSRAREILRSRLVRRGLGTSAAFLMTSLSRDAAFAEVVPSRLVDETVRVALLATRDVAAAAGQIPGWVEALADDSLPRPRTLLHFRIPKVGVFVAILAAVAAALLFSAGLVQAGGLINGPLIGWFSPSTQDPAAARPCH